MTATIERTITLPVEDAQLLDSLVASGKYTDDSEALRDGLHAINEFDPSFEKWLRERGVPVCERTTRGEATIISSDEVLERLATVRARRA